MSSVLLALAAAPPGAAVQQIAPEPVGTLQGLISADDYPVEALDRNEQGDVGILVRVDPTGAVTDCIVEHSASAILDARTCDLIRQRAKFSPARDRDGRPVASEKRTRISWRLARSDVEPSDPWAYTAILTYAPDGTPLSCRMEFEGTKAYMRSATCRAMPLPPGFEQLGAVSQLSIGQTLTLGPAKAAPLGPNDMLAEHTVLALQVDPTGKVSSCSVIESMSKVGRADGCILVANRSFAPHKDPDGKPVAFSATLEFRNVVHLSSDAAAAPVH